MIAMCCQLPSTTTSTTITSADANPSPSATHARSSNQLGATRNHYTTEVGPRIRTMEPLWSPVVATGGKRSQIHQRQERQKHAKTVATRCHRLPETFMVRRGSTVRVRQRALRKSPQTFWAFVLPLRCTSSSWSGRNRSEEHTSELQS